MDRKSLGKCDARLDLALNARSIYSGNSAVNHLNNTSVALSKEGAGVGSGRCRVMLFPGWVWHLAGRGTATWAAACPAAAHPGRPGRVPKHPVSSWSESFFF